MDFIAPRSAGLFYWTIVELVKLNRQFLRRGLFTLREIRGVSEVASSARRFHGVHSSFLRPNAGILGWTA